MTIGILLVDDHAMVRQGLRLALQLQPGFQIIGEAENGLAAIDLAQALQPDVILLDLNMPDMNGIEVTQKVRGVSPESRVLILSGIQADSRVLATVEAGVDGYIVKDAGTAELAMAIRHVAAGESYFHPSVTQALIRYNRPLGVAPAATSPALTARELAVLQAMATSATNRDIADQLFVGEETIRTHVKHILRKLDQTNRTQAVLEGVRRGLISLE
jgi:DNA-binding NarL/FixJ family response regulator